MEQVEASANPLWLQASPLSDEQLRTLAELGAEHAAGSGEVLFAAGDASYDFYVVPAGAADVVEQARPSSGWSPPTAPGSSSARSACSPRSAGATPCTDWLDGRPAADPEGFLLTGHDLEPRRALRAHTRTPFAFETSLPGVFCVGDARSGSVKRVATAVGEGRRRYPWSSNGAGSPGRTPRPGRAGGRGPSAQPWRAL